MKATGMLLFCCLLNHRCLENVKDGKSVAPSLRLMQRIIDAQPESSNKAWGNLSKSRILGTGGRAGGANAGGVRQKHEILETLDTHYNLLNLLVDVSCETRAVAVSRCLCYSV